MPRSLLYKLCADHVQDARLTVSTTQENFRRLAYLCALALPFEVLNLCTFWLLQAGSGAQAHWRHGLVLSHGSLTAIFAVLGLLAWQAKRHPLPTWAARLAVDVAVLTMLDFGVVIALVDQAVTPNISPMMIGCTLTATLFLLPPSRSVPLFLVTTMAFILLLPSNPLEPQWRFSNQLNALTSDLTGALLSLILWKSHLRQLRLRTQRHELRERNRQLEHLAGHDPLTGLYNRREFDRLVQRELARASRDPESICLILVDVDHFKSINDSFGHPIGDETIKRMAELLASHTRESDSVARIGGEEFLILLPATPSAAGRTVAQKLRELIAETPLELDGATLSITASFGVACLGSGHSATYEELYEAADQALYLAKQNGRNRIESIQLD